MAERPHYGGDRVVVITVRVLVYLVYWFLVVELILALAFVLKALGADPSTGFAAWV